jgi:hypothetical protein
MSEGSIAPTPVVIEAHNVEKYSVPEKYYQ